MPTIQRAARSRDRDARAAAVQVDLLISCSGWRRYGRLMKQAAAAWVEDRAPTMGAALAFYSAFSLAPLLIIVIALAGAAFGEQATRDAIVGQLATLVGPAGAQAIQELLKGAQEKVTGFVATAIGLFTMLVGATTILVELQDDLDYIWQAPRRPGNTFLTILRARVVSLGLILGIGFLLLISLVVNGAIAASQAYLASYFPGTALVLLQAWDYAFSVAAVTILFAMLYKWLPNVSIAWSDVWTGALTTAVLFSAGRIAIGVYLGRGAIASAYGAAGTLIVLLLWLYYSAQVLLLGAEFTCLHARFRTQARELALTAGGVVTPRVGSESAR
jgi:membrane protein